MNPISLHIFAKNRDATAVEKGYEFQRVSTLAQWLYNKVHKIPDDIFYDYGDDIFQNNDNLKSRNFKQLKLYDSESFSFASEEVKKAISHFFFLFWKQRQEGYRPTFVFETNTGIAAKRGNNGSELLSEWHKNQGAMTDELVARCIERCKTIVDPFVEAQYKALTEKEETKAEAENEKIKYNAIGNDIWRDFVLSITWSFSDRTSDEVLNETIETAYSLIDELPFPVGKDQRENVFSRLYREVGNKSVEDNPEDRCLNIALMDRVLLSMGDSGDKDYKEIFENWQENGLDVYTIGQFYEVLNAAKYCRRHEYLTEHCAFWKGLLEAYYNYNDFPPSCKREALYEILLLTLKPTITLAGGTLIGNEALVQSYFADFEVYDTSGQLEDTLNLLTFTIGAQKTGKVNLSNEYILELVGRFDTLLKSKLQSNVSTDEKCRIIELQGFFCFNLIPWKLCSEQYGDALSILRKIIDLLPQTTLYPISQLEHRVADIIRLMVSYGPDETDITPFEEFQEEISKLIQPREGNLSAGKVYVERGVSYLSRGDKQSLIRAINCFHKSKTLWYQDNLLDGYVLATLNIAQFYPQLKMAFAAKYYALTAYWVARNTTDATLYKRLSDSTRMLFFIDYTHGAWINALYDFRDHLDYKVQFDPVALDDDSSIWQEALLEASIMLHFVPKICPELGVFIEFFKTKFGSFYETDLKPKVDSMNNMDLEKMLTEGIKGRVIDKILNDIGKNRIIEWTVLGCTWQIKFDNNYDSNAIGEEFCAILQIIQAEIELQGDPFQLRQTKVVINITTSANEFCAKRSASSSEPLWKVGIMKIDSNVSEEVNAHYNHLGSIVATILRNLSTLAPEEFARLFHEFMAKNDIAAKTLTVQAYQKMYRKYIEEPQFNEAQRINFQAINDL